MAIIWQTDAGNLGTLTERVIVNIPLEATSQSGSIKFELISGSLPRGLRLSTTVFQDSTQTNAYISGSPVEVKLFTTSRFVIRASELDANGNVLDIEDRTFSLSVDGTDIPVWTTAEGFLNVGPENAFYVLDNSYVNFQLTATDADESAGDTLKYYLLPRAGELPPGLTLSEDGIISGFTDPIFALEYNGNTSGGYDTAPWDITPLDFVEFQSNGYDDYFYDNVVYDYSESSRTPRRLSRVYTFGVSVSDGVNSVNRIFKIYVVTEEFLQADNTIIQSDTTLFQADSASNRRPLWITSSNLGRFRANNYVTIFLDVYDPPELEGTITYFLLNTNPGSYKFKNSKEVVSGRYEISGNVPEFKFNFRDTWIPNTNYSVGDCVLYTDSVTYDYQGPWVSTNVYAVGDGVLYNTSLYVAVRANTAQNPLESLGYWKKVPVIFWVCQTANTGQTPSTGIYWNQDLSTANGRFNPANTSDWEVITKETVSTVPSGMELDSTTGEIAGKVPYQARVTETYNFTVLAVNFTNNLGDTDYTLVGDWNSYTSYKINDAVRYLGFIYVCIKDNIAQLPTDIIYWNLGVSSSEKTFTVEVIGEIESAVNWITPEDRGTIKPNQPSTLYVEAESLLYGGRVGYEFVSGSLPPGLEFVGNGQIQGKVKQFEDESGPGLTRFFWQVDSLNPLEDSSTFSRDFDVTFDGGSTSFDKKFSFTIMARDSVNFAESLRTFYVTVVADQTTTYANLYVKAFQSKSKRLLWYDFITDANIFKPNEIYRYGDPNFGIQTDLKVLVFAGIESLAAVDYIQAMSRNHHNKRLLFGDVKVGLAKDPITQETIYEVIYVDVIDEFEKNKKSISQTIELSDTIESKVLVSYDAIKIDSNIPLVSDSDNQRIFPNSFKNMRRRIWDLGQRDREFLPLWMRSIQNSATYELGYTKALPLCFAKPGASIDIMARIKAHGFDFKSLDFVADRYIIDIIDGQIEEQYLAFPQRGILNKYPNAVTGNPNN